MGEEPLRKLVPPCIGSEQAPGRKYSKQQGGSAQTHPVCMLVLRTAFYGAYTEPQACLNTAGKGPQRHLRSDWWRGIAFKRMESL